LSEFTTRPPAPGTHQLGLTEETTDNVTIMRASAWPRVHSQSALLELVSQLQHGEPYNYRPDEVPASEDWFPALVDLADTTLVAYDPPGEPIGYCVALGVTAYPDVLAVASNLGITASSTAYLAELGVSISMRRRGVASMLLDHLLAAAPAGALTWIVRTLEINTPAIALYQGHGFELVPAVTTTLEGRPRVYLIRQ
jgi:ribosomal protein S18 acetylase RimI-like enzyme